MSHADQSDLPASGETLNEKLRALGSREAAEFLAGLPPASALDALQSALPDIARDIRRLLPAKCLAAITELAPPEIVALWEIEHQFPEGTIGALMDVPTAVFPPEMTVDEAIENLREIVKTRLVTYCFVAEADRRLLGVITMRDLLFCEKTSRLGEVMLRDVFALRASEELVPAMRRTLGRHYPVYPVVDDEGRLVGLVRGQTMFAAQAFELSAQAGSMVGVEKEERLSTPWQRSFVFRHPWLQVNLLTAFVAAAVVGIFEETISQVVALAVFLPVLAGQSGNTGCQALAVALRAITLGELAPSKARRAIFKEALLGFLNGAAVGLTAGLGMVVFASLQKNPDALLLGLTVFLAMVGSCAVSGVAGAGIPVLLKKLGADPATASSIFLTTATDVVSMGLFLWLATVLVL